MKVLNFTFVFVLVSFLANAQLRSGNAVMQGENITTPTTNYTRAVFSHNAHWDELQANWIINQVGANDAQAILIPNKGGFEFIIHQTTGNVPRQMTHSEFLSGRVMTISKHGDVGIGTDNPNAKLEILHPNFTSQAHTANSLVVRTSTAPSSNDERMVGLTLTIDEAQNLNNNDQKSAGIFAKSVSNFGNNIDMLFYTRGIENTSIFQEGMRLSHRGNLLIGKSSQANPSYRLDVDGAVRANEIVVNTNGADFVFANDYQLRPLAEVEAFIKANKHLPEIAPAAEMQKNGVGLAKLNTQLLQKIEELTLYTIQLNKENDALKQKMKKYASLAKRLEKLEKMMEKNK